MRKPKVSILSLIAVAVLATVFFAVPPVYGQDSGIINQQILDDFVADVTSRVRSGQLDISQAFTVDYDLVLYSDGRFDSERSKLLKRTGDSKLIEAAKAGIIALGESGYFSYLSSLQVTRGRISIAQNGKNFSFIIKGDTKSPRHAQTIATGLGMYVKLGRAKVQTVTEKLILENIKVSEEGSNFVIDFSVLTSELKRFAVG